MKDYKKIIEGVINIIKTTEKTDIGFANICSYLSDNCDELFESEDERIRKEIISALKWANHKGVYDKHIAWLEKQESAGEIVERCKTSWYNEGKIQGQIEGLSDDEKYQQGWHDALEKQGEQPKEFTYTHEVEVGNGNIKGLVTEKVQLPKFKVGDHVTNGYYRCRIESIDDTTYYCNFTNIDIKNQDKWMLVEQETDFKPKFNGGDWIVWQDKCYKVNYNGCGYELVDQNGLSTSLEYGTIDEGAHLWSIEEAKEGDVLYSPRCKLLWLYKDKNTCYVGNNLNYHSDSIVVNSPICIPTDARPATKEQRGTLFAKMRKAGYEWDIEKKELKRIETL